MGIADDIGRNELAVASLIIEGLNGSILDAGELADDGLHLLQFDAETTDLHLTVTTTYKLDVAIAQIADDIAGLIDACVFLIFLFSLFAYKGITDIDFRRLLRTVQVSTTHLWTAYPELTHST